MDFTFPEEITALRAAFADFLKREIQPIEDEIAPQWDTPYPDKAVLMDAMARVRALSVEAGRGCGPQRLAVGHDRHLAAEPRRPEFTAPQTP